MSEDQRQADARLRQRLQKDKDESVDAKDLIIEQLDREVHRLKNIIRNAAQGLRESIGEEQ